MSVTIQDCDCALRSFWDGPCEYHTNHPLNDVGLEKKFSDYGAACQIEWNKAIDPIVEQCAKELGWHAGRDMAILQAEQVRKWIEEDVDKEFHILPMPPVPPEAWQFIEEAQAAANRASGFNEPIIGKSHEQEEHNKR